MTHQKNQTVFPPYLPRCVHPGLYIADKGDVACGPNPIDGLPLAASECSRLAAQFRFESRWKSRCDVQIDPAYHGYTQMIQSKREDSGRLVMFRLDLCLNEARLKGYTEAYQLAEKRMLDPLFFAQDSHCIADFFKDIYRKLNINRPGMTGDDRTNQGFHYQLTIPERDSLAYIKKVAENPRQVEVFERSLGKTFNDFNKEEREVWTMLGQWAPSPEKVPALMLEWIDRLVGNMLFGPKDVPIDPLQVASQAVLDFEAVKPWDGDDGIFGIWLLNVVLAYFDKESLVMPGFRAYSEAVKQGARMPQKFFQYLNETVVPWNKQARETLMADR